MNHCNIKFSKNILTVSQHQNVSMIMKYRVE